MVSQLFFQCPTLQTFPFVHRDAHRLSCLSDDRETSGSIPLASVASRAALAMRSSEPSRPSRSICSARVDRPTPSWTRPPSNWRLGTSGNSTPRGTESASRSHAAGSQPALGDLGKLRHETHRHILVGLRGLRRVLRVRAGGILLSRGRAAWGVRGLHPLLLRPLRLIRCPVPSGVIDGPPGSDVEG